MFRRLLIVAAVLLTLVFASSQTAWAQAKPKQKWVAVKGKIAGISGDQVSVVDDKGTPLSVVTLSKKTQFSVNGAADPDFITPGTVVQLSATLTTKQREIETPVKDLMVCEMSDTFKPGITPEGGPDAAIALKKDPDAAVRCLIRGQVKANIDGTIEVSVTPKDTIKFTLDPSAKIKVSITNGALVRKGDQIDATGYETAAGVPKANTPNQVNAARVVISGTVPFGSKRSAKEAPAPATPAAPGKPAAPPKK